MANPIDWSLMPEPILLPGIPFPAAPANANATAYPTTHDENENEESRETAGQEAHGGDSAAMSDAPEESEGSHPPNLDQVHWLDFSGLEEDTAALDLFSMESTPPLFPPVHPVEPFFSMFSMEQFPAVAPSPHALGLAFAMSNNGDYGGSEEYLEILNKDRFLSLNDFYMNCLQRGTAIKIPIDSAPAVITRDDLHGDACDWQGIDWHMRRLRRSYVRSARTDMQTSLMPPSLREVRKHMRQTPNSESFFSFRRMDTAHRASIPHFQLRNLLGVSSRHVYYADRHRVLYTDREGSEAQVAMDLSKSRTEAGKFLITTLAASPDVVIAGGFEGEYALNSPYTNDPKDTLIGRINNDRTQSSIVKSHITNHISVSPNRTTYTPQAILSSNDNRLRVLDTATNTFTSCFEYAQAVNCTATSPNGRMRVIVGDFRETMVTDAETGRVFASMKSHVDDAFACDWADDGIHVATAAQDSTVVVWDARNWSVPLKVLYSELSIPRVVRFSPVGGGPPVLVVGEADDYVSVVDARGFEGKQVLDFFGRTAGVAVSGDGQDLFVGVAEGAVGGIMGFERCGGRWGGGGSEESDWESEERMDADDRVEWGRQERRRRDLGLDQLRI